MKKLKFFVLVFVLSVMVPGFCWGALIMHDVSGLTTDVVTNLTTHLTGKGFSTIDTNVGVPVGSLSGYTQIWDVRYDNTTPLSASDMTAYTTYLGGGGSLYLMGDNLSFTTRDNSILDFIASVGGGTFTVTSPASQTQICPTMGMYPR